jgi:integrase
MSRKRDPLLVGLSRIRLTGSFKTQYNHKVEARRFVEQLRKNGFGVKKWKNITNKHVAAVVKAWKEQGLSDKTIKEYLAGVRAVAEAYGNDRISKDNSSFGLEKGTSTPKSIDKSANEEIYQKAVEKLSSSKDINQQRLAVQLQYMRELGLRHEEARKLNALHAERQTSPEGQQYIRITDGTKGGKERWVPINEKAAKALEKGAELQRKYGTKNLMDPKMTERQWERFAYRTVRKLGFGRSSGCTFHSLRHSFAQELFKEKAGFDPPIKFDSFDDFVEEAKSIVGDEWKDRYQVACRAVESALGHGHDREDIRGTYIG